MNQSGHIFYQDSYEAQYVVDWETINGVIDLTSIVMQPFVWGEPNSGYRRNGVIFRRGVITVERQAIRVSDNELIASGVSQYVDFIQMNYPCQEQPRDSFKYHLNYGLVDKIECVVVDGPRWADPDSALDLNMVWGDVDETALTDATDGTELLAFIDVWSA